MHTAYPLILIQIPNRKVALLATQLTNTALKFSSSPRNIMIITLRPRNNAYSKIKCVKHLVTLPLKKILKSF